MIGSWATGECRRRGRAWSSDRTGDRDRGVASRHATRRAWRGRGSRPPSTTWRRCRPGSTRSAREAHAAGMVARTDLQRAGDRLREARSWSTWDMFGGGGFLTDMMKYDRLDEVSALLGHADLALKRFSRELADLRLAGVAGVDVDGLTCTFDVSSTTSSPTSRCAPASRRPRSACSTPWSRSRSCSALCATGAAGSPGNSRTSSVGGRTCCSSETARLIGDSACRGPNAMAWAFCLLCFRCPAGWPGRPSAAAYVKLSACPRPGPITECRHLLHPVVVIPR